MLQFEFEGADYSIYPTEVEAYFHSPNFPDPYTPRHELQRANYGHLFFHGAGMDLCLSDDQDYLSFFLRSGYVLRDGENVHIQSLPVVGPANLRQAVFGVRGTALLRSHPVTALDVLRSADSMSVPERFYTMIGPRLGLDPDVDARYAGLRLRTVSDATMKHRDYRPKEALLDSYFEIVSLTPQQRYQVARKLMDRCPSKYIIHKK